MTADAEPGGGGRVGGKTLRTYRVIGGRGAHLQGRFSAPRLLFCGVVFFLLAAHLREADVGGFLIFSAIMVAGIFLFVCGFSTLLAYGRRGDFWR